MFYTIESIKRKELRSFRLVLNLVCLTLIFIVEEPTLYILVGFVFLLVNISKQTRVFKHLNMYWLNLGIVLSIINSTILFSIIYVLVLTPIGLFFRVINRDILGKAKIYSNPKTYWIERKSQPESMKLQY